MATAKIYNNALLELVSGTITFPNTQPPAVPPYKVMLIAATPSYTYSPSHTSLAQVKSAGATEISGTGYTTGGGTVPSITPAINSNAIEVNLGDVVWPNSTITARAAILYKPTGNDSTSTVVAYIDFGTNVSSNNSAFTLDFQTPLKLQN